MSFVILVLLFYTGFVYINNDLNIKPNDNVSVISPFPEKLNRDVKLFFIYDDQLLYESRKIHYDNQDIISEVAKQLKKGPKVRKYEAGLSEEVHIQSVSIENRVCYVNLSSNFANELLEDSERGLLNVWSIVNTFCDLREVDSVLLLSEGEKLNIELGEIYLGENLFSNNLYAYIEDKGPTEFVNTYLMNISESRFDLAYEMIDHESRELVDYNAFIEDMENYTSQYAEYRRGIQFSQRRDDKVFVYVKYLKIQIDETSSNSPVFEKYEVVNEADSWKIKYISLEE